MGPDVNELGDATNPPPLSMQYHKARTQLALFSGLLAAWELIGIDLSPETSFENVKIVFKSPQAAPLVLIALIAYFWFRFAVEWLQCDEARRLRIPAQFDFYAAQVLATSALVLFAVQRWLSLQVADYLSKYNVLAFSVGLSIGIATCSSIATVLGALTDGEEGTYEFIGTVFWSAPVAVVSFFGVRHAAFPTLTPQHFYISVGAGALVASAAYITREVIRWSSERRDRLETFRKLKARLREQNRP
jgi:hypothetical protein